MYEDTPDEVCLDKLAAAYYGERGYGAAILGPQKNVNSFTKKSVLDYKSKYYTTDNIVVSIAGAIDIQQAKDICEKYLGGMKQSKKAEPPKKNLDNLKGNVAVHKDIEQAHIALAVSAPEIENPIGDCYSILSNSLGGGMSSRLFQTVREKMGLCYSVYSYNTTYCECGHMTIYAGVGLNNYAKAFDAILNEIKKLKRDGITSEEFLRTREQMKSAFVMSQESTMSQMILLGRLLLLTGKLFDMNERLKDINALTLDKVNDVIKNRFDIENFSTSIVGRGVKPLVG
jgi:predicted Zn-dependent peptidase